MLPCNANKQTNEKKNTRTNTNTHKNRNICQIKSDAYFYAGVNDFIVLFNLAIKFTQSVCLIMEMGLCIAAPSHTHTKWPANDY